MVFPSLVGWNRATRELPGFLTFFTKTFLMRQIDAPLATENMMSHSGQEPSAEASGTLTMAFPSTLDLPIPRRSATNVTPVQAWPRPPKVSILIPTYNYARYLPEAIESVLEQNFDDYELIIVDDCSRDESEAVIRHYAALDNRIRCEFNPVNLGLVGNWNYCLSLARGEYIKFLFGDDKLADRQALQKMVQMLEENPSAVLAVSARNIIDENSAFVESGNHMGANGLHPGLEVIVRCLESNANLIGEPSVVLMRKRDISRGFNTQYLQIPDLEMWFHLLEKGNAVYTAEPLCAFRKHSRQQTEVNRVNQVGEREQLILLSDYYVRPWLRNRKRCKLLFSQIYCLKKKKHFGDASRELQSRMMASLGVGRYAWFWTLHKLGRPFTNLKRFYQKRILRMAVR
jgi:glycosyltransferase involved in cell wall biosynthesis